jgi:hypothetical protein
MKEETIQELLTTAKELSAMNSPGVSIIENLTFNVYYSNKELIDEDDSIPTSSERK